ncbi:hypothetical protein HTY52_22775 [Cupriavidus taiwanensis]|uniref:hypothetical protein n=1 Tax=Cupriavidus taiwanensis TaxID=164546 RepID=UPI00157343DB|nr:hypothetical protein [Cupriavidus taiwanensis]NSX16920.1 hypothetical protein [Cupriavidus taiwanensis]
MTDFFETLMACDPEPATHIPRARTHLPTANLNVLALDLGTTTGWAVATRDGRQRSGSMRLDPKKLGGNGRRWIAFREWLTATAREVGGVQVVYVEDVRRHVSNLSARVYCGYLAMLEAWCAANNVRMELVGVGTVKKHWTGNGRASKTDMIVEAERRGINVLLDDEADALAILAYGVAQEA